MKTNRIIISAQKRWILPSFRELYQSRELLFALTMRDIQVRYKQSALGIAWAVIQPLMTMVVFTVIFGNFAKIPSEGLPYPIFSMAAILPWQLFAKALSQGSVSLVSLGNMMSKVYFPRLIAPVSVILSGLIDFFIAFTILIAMMLWYGIVPGIQVLTVPLIILFALLVSLSISLFLASVNVKYRDVQHMLPFLVQIWMYLTPVVYPISVVPDAYKSLYMLNPMAGIIELFRWALLNKPLAVDISHIGISIIVTIVMLFCSLIYFNRVEKSYVDQL